MNQKILFVAPSAYPLGGVAVWLEYLVHDLKLYGWDIVVGLVSGRYHNVGRYKAVYPALGPVIEIHNPTGSWQGRINSLANAIQIHQPDLVIGVNIPDAYEAVNRLRQQQKTTAHVAMAIHSIEPDLIKDTWDYHDKLDGVICTNRLTMCLAQEEVEFDPERLFYAPCGVDMNTRLPGMSPDGKLRIAWVGRIDQFQKRVWSLLDIAKELAQRGVDFELLIAGSGPEEEALRKAFREKGLAQYIRFLGMVPPEKMYKNVYSACDVLLVTSYWETGPIIIWEAMANGKPVVSSRYIGSGLEAGLRDGENALLFDIENASAAVDQLIKLQDTDTYKRIANGGLELVSSRYSKSVSVQHWNQVCSEIISMPARSASERRVIPQQGKLDHLLGVRLGENVRKALRVSHSHVSAGGEWPHSYGYRKIDDAIFWQQAKKLDRYPLTR